MESEVFDSIYKLQTGGWWFGNARNKLVIELLRDRLHTLENIKVLDCGCSEGAFLDYLKKAKTDFHAIDFDPYAIEFCRKRGLGNRVKQGSFLDIPYKSNSFDVVTALDVVEHVKEDNKALSEMKRVCRKGGIVFLIVPAHQWLWSSNDVAYHHHRRYDIKMITQVAKHNKLEIEAISYFNVFLFPVFVVFTFFRKIFPNDKNSNVLKPVPRPVNNILRWIMGREINVVRKNVSKGKLGLIGGSLVVMLRKR